MDTSLNISEDLPLILEGHYFVWNDQSLPVGFLMLYTKPTYEVVPMLVVGEVGGLFESPTVSMWILYGM